MDIGLSVQQVAGQVNLSPNAGLVKKSESPVCQSVTGLLHELVKLRSLLSPAASLGSKFSPQTQNCS